MDFHCEKLKLRIRPFEAGVRLCAKRQRPRKLRLRNDFGRHIHALPDEPCGDCGEGRRNAALHSYLERGGFNFGSLAGAEWIGGKWRRCPQCKTELPLSRAFFHSDAHKGMGLHYACRVCEAKRQRDYYVRHKEERREYKRGYWQRGYVKEANRQRWHGRKAASAQIAL